MDILTAYCKQWGLNQTETLAGWMAEEFQERAEIFLLIYHGCSDEPAEKVPARQGPPHDVWVCPLCGMAVVDADALRYDFARERVAAG